jgi:predicted transposase/invertase (TIGR01784 family)
LDEGRTEGRTEGKLEIAARMKQRGRPLAEIAEDTGLAVDVLEKL